MKQRKKPIANKRLSRKAAELVRLAILQAQAGSALEENFCKDKLSTLVHAVLEEEGEEDFNASLSELFETDDLAHSALIEAIETCAECGVLPVHDESFDVLLFNVPILAWSRFALPSGALDESSTKALRKHLLAYVFAKNARIVLLGHLFSVDQMPNRYVDIWRLRCELGQAALTQQPAQFDFDNLPKTTPFLSDMRYLVGALAVPKGAPLFRWNEKILREDCIYKWGRYGMPNLGTKLTGCAFKLLLPDAWHSGIRTAETVSRTYFLKASVLFLREVLEKSPDFFRATIGGFYDKELEEYRIGFGSCDSDEIYHGIAWPILSEDEVESDIAAEIEMRLREVGIKEVIVHTQQFPFEFCDDCGAPLYPNPEGETAHAHMPGEEDDTPHTLH